MAELFGSSKQAISYHLQNIFESNELGREATVKEILTVQAEGGRQVKRSLEHYNLDVAIHSGEILANVVEVPAKFLWRKPGM